MKKTTFLIASVSLLIVMALCVGGCSSSGGSGATTRTRAQQALIDALPQDPGDAGKVTLEGIDSDGDGVRDDVQRYIVLNYLDSAKTRAALMQYAKELQTKIQIADSDEEVAIEMVQASNALYCLLYVFRDDSNLADEISTKLDLQVRNTNARWEASAKFSSQLVGQSFGGSYSEDEKKAKCSFNTDTMKD